MPRMRHLPFLLAIACAALAEPPKNEAEELFRKMEAKLAGAKTLHVVCKAREPRENGDRHDATFWISGAKVRVDYDWWAVKAGEVKWSVISDGAKCWDSRRRDSKREAPKSLAAAAAVGFARTGTWAISELSNAIGSGKDPGDGKSWELSEFRLGPKEKNLQAVEYAVNAGKPDAMTFTVWIDVKSLLPAKRDVDIGGWKLAETYEITPDGKIEDGTFK